MCFVVPQRKGMERDLTSFRARSRLDMGRSEAEKEALVVKEPRVTGCSCRLVPVHSCFSFPVCTVQGNSQAFLPPHVLGTGISEGLKAGIFSLSETTSKPELGGLSSASQGRRSQGFL